MTDPHAGAGMTPRRDWRGPRLKFGLAVPLGRVNPRGEFQ